MIRATVITAIAICCCHAAHSADQLTYEQHIRPIFRAHCFDCHGATEELKGGLDLRQVRLMIRGGESGPAIVASRPDESFLLDRIRNGEMPPGEHRVPDDEIKTIEHWIAQGARTARPEPESIGVGLGITPEERSFWAFQPIRRPVVPKAVIDHPRVRNPIDAFALQKMRHGNHEFSPDADRRTLVIRAWFDLLGLPPSPEQLRRWVNDSSEDWYDQLLTHLLSSPRYGERWARHWLDVAGYADSEGYTVADAERPWAWKYRDWVIRALNADKSFDQFITEQLAGDELAGPIVGDLTEEQIDLLTATGFLRMAADGTGSGANDPSARNQVMTDTLKIVGTSLFGLSIQCAQCHDHRYDPIPQTDYYALRAVFEPALDWNAWKTPNARRVSLYTAADREQAAAIEAEAGNIASEKSVKLAEYMKQALDAELMKYDEPLRASLRQAYETPGDKRSEEHKKLLSAHPSINISPGNLYQYIPDSKPRLAEFDKRIAEVRAKKPVEEFLRALVEPAKHVTETKLFHRGDHAQPKQTVLPAALTVATPEGQRFEFPVDDTALPTTGRRLALARWMTSRDNPLLARVIVNRVWMHHFGQGLVITPADFGKLGAPPINPPLLDWLADEFIRQDWSLKQLHRLIMSSTVYRQQVIEAAANPHARKLRRLEAETIRDRMLAANGLLDAHLFGPPLKIKEDDTGQIVVDGAQARRSLYIQARRSRPVGMLQMFDAPVMATNCESRSDSTVATQSLMMLNGQFILDQAARLADRAAAEPAIVDEKKLKELPRMLPPDPIWQYGYGWYDEANDRTAGFNELTHWTGTHWRAGPDVPDPQLGWVMHHASGGHPDIQERSAIRRWIAPRDGTIQIDGSLSHPAENGDGVRGRIVSSRLGKAGQWNVHHGSANTTVAAIEVRAGDTIDFVTDCLESVTSDSFTWKVTITLASAGQGDVTISSEKHFRGPAEELERIPGQIVRAWQLAYCRPPSDDELRLAMRFVTEQIKTLEVSPDFVPQGRTMIRQAMTNLCQSLFASNEFLYVE